MEIAQSIVQEALICNKNYFYLFNSILNYILFILLLITFLLLSAMSNKSQALKLKKQADDAYTDQNFTKALQLYTKAIAHDQTNPALYHNRSLSYLKLNNIIQALQDAEVCIKMDPQFIKGYIRKAETHLELGQPNEALEILEKADALFQKSNQQIEILKSKAKKETHIIPKSPKWKRLNQWLQQEGANFEKLMVAQFHQNYRGIFAKRSISKKERILYIPLNRMITLEMSKQLPLSRKLLSNSIELQSPKHTFLSIFLLNEFDNEQSIWKPYIDLLPKQFPSVPIFFNTQELQLLEGSPFLFMIHEKVIDIKKQYQTICKFQPDFTKHSFKQFCWARVAVSSRVFGLNINGVKTDALVPFADMINHKIPKQSSWIFAQKQKGFVMQATQDIQRGQEVFDSYGKKCNTRFLLNYGFVIENNESNQVPFKVTLSTKDPLLHKKIQMIGQKPAAKIFKVSSISGDGTLYELLGFLRFRLFQDQSILNAIKQLNNIGEVYIPCRTPPITKYLQIKCWQFIQQMAQQTLKGYVTTLQQDQQMLLKGISNQNTRNCVILRLGQKRLYNYFIKMAKQMMMLLVKSSQDLKNECLKPQFMPYRDYIQKVVISLVVKQ